jgi:septal ring factor EnvC (AmiA/AmiB activator)
LAFLDVMACGLGAVILILVVLKQQAPIEAAPQPENIISTEQVQADLDRLQDELDNLQAARAASQSDLQAQTDRVAKMAVAVEQTSTDLVATSAQTDALDQSISAATDKLASQQQAMPPDAIDTRRTTQPQYLVGMKVTGKKIVILLDRSASMTARSLLQIVQYKAGPAAARRSAEKWVNAQNAVWWLTARAPAQSKLQIASFSDTTNFHTDNWVNATDSTTLAALKAKMAPLVPEASTNLQAAVEAAMKAGADSIYIITDGLPTAAPGGQGLLGLDGCGSKLFSRKQVTGKCRVSLFQRTVATATGKPVRISIVLMPLEGDPDAAPLFSKWALSKGGVMLSAAKDWP